MMARLLCRIGYSLLESVFFSSVAPEPSLGELELLDCDVLDWVVPDWVVLDREVPDCLDLAVLAVSS